MPDYLHFDSTLVELTPEEAEAQLKLQLVRLREALAKLNQSDRVSPDVYQQVVSL